MTTMSTMELNNNELKMVNGGGYLLAKYLKERNEEQKRLNSLKYPKMDVDNRPAIDLTLHRPTPQQV